MERMWKWLASVCVAASVYLLVLGQSFGAGVTIITHGYLPNSDSGMPVWVQKMGDAVHSQVKAETGGDDECTASYSIRLTCGTSLNPNDWGWDITRTSSYSPTSSRVVSGEIIICIDWSDASGFIGIDGLSNISLPVEVTSIAPRLAEYLCDRREKFDGICLAEQPIHLIGHSRGGAMMVYLAEALGMRGIWVNQLTTLDPHPVEGIDGPASLFKVRKNVLFADNYLQDISYPEGKQVPGSYTRKSWKWGDLSDVFFSIPHGDVHTWYHGTIDTSNSAYDGKYVIDDPIRNDTGWYLPEENKGKASGYYYSRIKGGTFTGGTRSGLADYLPDGSKWAREPWVFDTTDGENTVWDNIEICNLTAPVNIGKGNYLEVIARFFDWNNDATITLGFDSDQNPYNGGMNAALYTKTTAAIGGDQSGTRALDEWLGTSTTSEGTNYVYAKITNGTRTRYYYSHAPVVISAADSRIIGISGDLAFGSISVGSNSSKTMTIANTGNRTLNVTSISYPTGFSGNWSGGSIPAGSSRSVTVTFSPTAVKNYGGTITVASDKTSGTNTKACSGTGVQAIGELSVVSPVGNPPQVGDSSVVFRGKAPIGSTRVGYINATTSSSNSNWDEVESDGTWGGRSINMAVGNNSITITSYNSSGSITGSKTLTVVRLNNIKTASVGATTCVAFYSGRPKTSHSGSSYVGYDPSYGIERTLLHFSFPSLPKGSSISGGQLRGVTVNDSEQQHGASFNVTAYMVNAAWSSSDNWNSFILGNDVPYVSNGASTQSVPGADSWVYWDVTEICQYWYNGTPNYGFMLKAASSVENGTDWHDRWFKPDKYQLTVTYSVETTSPTISIASPTANSAYSTSSSTVNLAGQASDSQNTVTVTWNNALTGGSGNCTVSGTSWSVNGVALSAGVNRILVTATDAAGNASSDVIEVTYVPPTKVIRLSGSLAFGNVICGNQRTGEFFINNDGDAALMVTGITFPAGFTGDWNSGTIPAGGSRTVVVTFTPVTAQNYSGTITVASDKTSGENTIACSGTGNAVLKTIRVDGDLAFGNVVTNTSLAKNITIYNDGNTPLTVSSISYPTGFSGNWAGGTIPSGKSCRVVVAFVPTAIQEYTGTITVNSDKTSGINTLAPTGSGIAATRIIRLTGELAFGNVTERKTKSLKLTISNDGNSSLTITNITYPSGFSGVWSGMIPAGSSNDVTVTFCPSIVQSYEGTIVVGSDKTSGANTTSCSGIGVAAVRSIRLSGDLDFGFSIEGEPVTRTLTIFNEGDSELTISGISFPVGFSGNWSGVLQEGASSNVVVTFTPTAAGVFGGSIIVNSDKTHGDNTISCEGAGIAATRVVRLTGDLVFGALTVGQVRTKDLTIHNDGNSELTINSITCPTGFAVHPDDFTVGSNQAVNVNVIFTPDAVQSYSGILQVQSDATAGGDSLTCSGTGTIAVDLPEALDNTNLVWTTGGGTNWFGQVNITRDSSDAACSGAMTNGVETWIQTTVTGPGTVSFWWKVSSESGGDFLRFTIDEGAQDEISGETGWVKKTYEVEEGGHTLKWNYVKNSAAIAGSDCGWVDQVVYTKDYVSPPEDGAALTSPGTYDGFFYNEEAFGDYEATAVRGTLNVKVTKVDAGAGIIFTAKAVLQKGSLSFGSKAWTGTEAEGTLRATLAARGGETLDLYVRQDRIWGTLSGGSVGGALELDGARNRFVEKGDADAQTLLNRYLGYYTVALPAYDALSLGAADAAPQGVGYLAVTVGKGGSAKIAGVLADGTKVTHSSQLVIFGGDDGACVPFFAPLYAKQGWAGGLLWVAPDRGAVTIDRELGWFVRWENPGKGPEGFRELLNACGGYYSGTPSLAAQYLFGADAGEALFSHADGAEYPAVFPDGVAVTAAGMRMTMEKGTKPRKVSEGGDVWYEYADVNPTSATLTFTARTGLLKGKFSLYYDYWDASDRLMHKAVNAPYAGVLTPVRDAAFNVLPVGLGHCLVPESDPALKAYKIKRSFPVWLEAE